MDKTEYIFQINSTGGINHNFENSEELENFLNLDVEVVQVDLSDDGEYVTFSVIRKGFSPPEEIKLPAIHQKILLGLDEYNNWKNSAIIMIDFS